MKPYSSDRRVTIKAWTLVLALAAVQVPLGPPGLAQTPPSTASIGPIDPPSGSVQVPPDTQIEPHPEVLIENGRQVEWCLDAIHDEDLRVSFDTHQCPDSAFPDDSDTMNVYVLANASPGT
ncbi:MAG: hypothetical protein ACRDI1_11520, partial [Actinomycetota bacterium]